MDEQDRKAQRMIKVTVCLCGLLILLKTGQTGLAVYDRPETFMLHETVALLADLGQRMFLPSISAGQEPSSAAQFAMDAMAEFFGWTMEDTGELYVEDEYTRQELIEAGRGGSLRAIQEENGAQTTEGENISTENEQSDEENDQPDTAQTEEHSETGTEQLKTDKSETETASTDSNNSPTRDTSLADDQPETVTEPEATTKESATEKDTPAENDTADPKNTTSVSTFQDIVADHEKMSPDELLKQYFIVDPVTAMDTDLLTYDTLTGMDLHIDTTTDGPQILIYHTHSQETFKDSVSTDPDTTIIGVGNRLEELLTQKGFRVLHVTDTFDVFGDKIDRNKAYTAARKKLKEILKEQPSLQVLLDIHRDGIAENKRLVTTVNGRKTAKIMFFNGLSRKKSTGMLSGLSNPYIQENLAFSFQTEYLCDLYYPELSRCIYLKAYRYNLDLLPRSMLVEVGAQTNTVEEAKNAMIPLADMLHKVLVGT